MINSKTASCIASVTSTSLPAAAAARDLDPFSVDGRLQVWVVEQDRDGWYIIKSFPFGNAFGAGDSGSLVFVTNDGSSSFQWKFIQDAKATTVRCVNRRFPTSVLAAQDGSSLLELVVDNSGPLQRFVSLYLQSIVVLTELGLGGRCSESQERLPILVSRRECTRFHSIHSQR